MYKYRKILYNIGLAGLGGMSVLCYITFLSAYFNNYKVIVLVNPLGEGLLELIILPIFLTLGLWVLYDIVVKIRNEVEV